MGKIFRCDRKDQSSNRDSTLRNTDIPVCAREIQTGMSVLRQQVSYNGSLYLASTQKIKVRFLVLAHVGVVVS